MSNAPQHTPQRRGFEQAQIFTRREEQFGVFQTDRGITMLGVLNKSEQTAVTAQRVLKGKFPVTVDRADQLLKTWSLDGADDYLLVPDELRLNRCFVEAVTQLFFSHVLELDRLLDRVGHARTRELYLKLVRRSEVQLGSALCNLLFTARCARESQRESCSTDDAEVCFHAATWAQEQMSCRRKGEEGSFQHAFGKLPLIKAELEAIGFAQRDEVAVQLQGMQDLFETVIFMAEQRYATLDDGIGVKVLDEETELLARLANEVPKVHRYVSASKNPVTFWREALRQSQRLIGNACRKTMIIPGYVSRSMEASLLQSIEDYVNDRMKHIAPISLFLTKVDVEDAGAEVYGLCKCLSKRVRQTASFLHRRGVKIPEKFLD